MPKVTMALTDRDAENAELVKQLTDARSKSHAVAVALALTRFITEKINGGAQLILRTPDGALERVLMPELENISRDSGVGGVLPQKSSASKK